MRFSLFLCFSIFIHFFLYQVFIPPISDEVQTKKLLPMNKSNSHRVLSVQGFISKKLNDLNTQGSNSSIKTNTHSSNQSINSRELINDQQLASDHLAEYPDSEQFISFEIVYPILARKRGWEGEVQISYELQDDKIIDVKILKNSNHPILNESAFNSIKNARILKPFTGTKSITVRFVLHK